MMKIKKIKAITVEPNEGDIIYVVDLLCHLSKNNVIPTSYKKNNDMCKRAFKNRMLHFTRDAAEKHALLILSITNG